MEERGRDLKPRSSNERVHIDAGAYGATNGARILRFFVNLHPTRERVWGTKGTFADCMRRYPELWDAANNGRPAVGLEKNFADRLYSRSIAALSAAVPLARNIDSSPYDRAMRRIHNRMKESNGFRDNDADYRTIHFPPMSAWMVFTDGISHSVLTGQYAFVTTVLVPLQNCQAPELAPFNVLAAHDAAALDTFLNWTDTPLVKFAEAGLVLLLSLHLFGGLRLLALEFLPWRGARKRMAAGAVVLAAALGLGYLAAMV